MEGEEVVIYGVGGLGIQAVQLAKSSLFKASQVFAVDILSSKLSLAQQYGAIPINANDGDVAEQIRQKSKDGRGADVALELVGHNSCTQAAVKCLRPKGRVVFVGIGGAKHTLNGVDVYSDILAKELELIGCSDHLGSELKELIHHVNKQYEDANAPTVLDLSKVVTRTIPFSDLDAINNAITELRNGTEHIRTVITFE